MSIPLPMGRRFAVKTSDVHVFSHDPSPHELLTALQLLSIYGVYIGYSSGQPVNPAIQINEKWHTAPQLASKVMFPDGTLMTHEQFEAEGWEIDE